MTTTGAPNTPAPATRTTSTQVPSTPATRAGAAPAAAAPTGAAPAGAATAGAAPARAAPAGAAPAGAAPAGAAPARTAPAAATPAAAATSPAATTTTAAATTTTTAAETTTTAAEAATAAGANAPTDKENEKKVAVINSKSQFDIKIAEAGNKLVIVEFYATWCGPCKIIGTKLEELAGKYENQALIIKLDVDECEDVAVEYNVTSMPTFVFLRNKKQVNQLIGSNSEKLAESVEKFCSESGPTDTHSSNATAFTAAGTSRPSKAAKTVAAKPAVK